jgi:hypothetical protein
LDLSSIDHVDFDRPVEIEARMEELRLERQTAFFPEGFFRPEANIPERCY